jgi:hypothetical protein
MVGGFWIGDGTGNKQIFMRARGPSMASAPFDIPGTLANPVLQLYSGSTVIAQNDDWETQTCTPSGPLVACGDPTQIIATGMDPCQPNPGQMGAPPDCTLEAALLVTLPPGGYTMIVSGVGDGTGVGMVEIFELGP